MALDPGGESLRRSILIVCGGDQVDDLDSFGFFVGDGAAELGNLSCARKVDPVGDIDNLDRAGNPGSSILNGQL
jgi:hypothetical protein